MSKPKLKYGNWMGAGHPPDLEGMVAREEPLPIPWNSIDDACKNHDFQYIQGNNDVWGNSEADRLLSIAMYRIADTRKMWRHEPQPPEGERENGQTQYKRVEDSALTDEEFFLVLAVAMEMEGQSHITLLSSLINGNLGSFFKHITLPKSILAPRTFTKAIAKYAAGKLGFDADDYIGKLIDRTEKGFEIILAQEDIVDVYHQYMTRAIDEIGDIAEDILDEAPETLKNVAKGSADDVKLLLTHPKKGLKKEGEKLLLIGGKALYLTKHPKKAIELIRKDGTGISLIAPGADIALKLGAGTGSMNIVIDAAKDVEELVKHPKKKLEKVGKEAEKVVKKIFNPKKWF